MPVIDQVFRLAHLPEPDIQPDTVGSRKHTNRASNAKGPPNAPSMAGVADSPASASDDVRE